MGSPAIDPRVDAAMAGMSTSDMPEAEFFYWRDYWARVPVSVVEFTNSVRAVIGLDPIPHGRQGEVVRREYRRLRP